MFFQRETGLKDYIVQRVNTYVFQDPIAMMENISSVTEYVRAKIKQKQKTAKRNVLHYSKTADGKYYTIMEDGGFWRCCDRRGRLQGGGRAASRRDPAWRADHPVPGGHPDDHQRTGPLHHRVHVPERGPERAGEEGSGHDHRGDPPSAL